MHKHKERKEKTKITINQSGTNQPGICRKNKNNNQPTLKFHKLHKQGVLKNTSSRRAAINLMLSGNHAKQKRLSKGFIPCHHAKNGSRNLLNLMIECTFKVEKSGNFSAINQNVETAEKVEKEI